MVTGFYVVLWELLLSSEPKRSAYKKMKSYLSKIDTKTLGIRYDVTPIFMDVECLSQLVEDLTKPFQESRIDYVACIDALGFILGTAIASRLGVGIIPIRKGNKLPVETDSVKFRDYSNETKQLEIRRDAFSFQARVLLVDEWIETGSQIQAATKLIERQGADIIGIATINMDKNKNTEELSKKYHICTA